MNKIVRFAIEAHNKANHLYDGQPYVIHLTKTVFFALKYIDQIPEDYRLIVLYACWLHDTIEDCRLTYNDIKSIAGEKVAEIVYAVTNEKGKTRDERANKKYYDGIQNTPFATFVKLCDRLANAQYSFSKKSSMFKKYKKENKKFTRVVLPFIYPKFYDDMVEELNSILNQEL